MLKSIANRVVRTCGRGSAAGALVRWLKPFEFARENSVIICMNRFRHMGWFWTVCLLGLCFLRCGLSVPAATPYYTPQATWVEAVKAAKTAMETARIGGAEREKAVQRVLNALEFDFPEAWDWLAQDAAGRFPEWFSPGQAEAVEQSLLAKVQTDLGADKLTALPGDALTRYAAACELRRAERLKNLLATRPEWVFVKNRTLLPSFFAYTEGQSDAQNERHFAPGGALCRFKLEGLYAKTEVLMEDAAGAMRDPDVSLDGQQVLVAWKKSLNQDDYHLYEWDLNSRQLRPITSGLGFADYEGCYVPGEGIVFSSTRCVQTVDCWWTEVSNLYTCDRQGRYLRRLSFDQVHAIHPALADDGRVLYTRWDYNDRGQIFPQGLFQMNPDGTGQTEFYGNNSWFPTTIAHARGIPGSAKVISIFTGHHSAQAGKLGWLDPALGRQENTGAQLIAPVRETPAERIDGYGQEGELFQYPYALSEREFVVTYAPRGWQFNQGRPEPAHFSLYWMDVDGRRELLVSDRQYACRQAVPVVARPQIAHRPSMVDYRKTNGTYYVQDIYLGPGLKDVPRGTVKKMRVVALDFRAAGVGHNFNEGVAGGALVSTPIAIGNGCWDVKMVLGETPVYADGSAFFVVPARTPVYFQAVNSKGHVVQTMRSWSTLQPGENQSCSGCHESKNSAPPAHKGVSLAAKVGPQELTPFYGTPRGFSFAREIQPILDRHCVTCHSDRGQVKDWAEKGDSERGKASRNPEAKAFSLRGETLNDAPAKRRWSDAYLCLTQSKFVNRDEENQGYAGNCDGPWVKWISPQSEPSMLPPYSAGACKSPLLVLLEQGHGQVKLTQEEKDKLACWIDLGVPYGGDYYEANSWTPEELAKYEKFQAKRAQMAGEENANISALLKSLAK